mmetsp:Transcript_2114/g.2867  ORF Transcript_2114/g.2867 Transcript_2114/m.2867 type:complete len:212 (+) Transcript_2114:902-1537(+)
MKTETLSRSHTPFLRLFTMPMNASPVLPNMMEMMMPLKTKLWKYAKTCMQLQESVKPLMDLTMESAQITTMMPTINLKMKILYVTSSPVLRVEPTVKTEKSSWEELVPTLQEEHPPPEDKSSHLPFSFSELLVLLYTLPCFILSSPREERPIFLPKAEQWPKFVPSGVDSMEKYIGQHMFSTLWFLHESFSYYDLEFFLCSHQKILSLSVT